MDIQIYCEKCRDKKYMPGLTYQQRYIQNIKHSRNISLDHFDIYDLDRPIKDKNGVILKDKNGNIIAYERVCRVCGAQLRTKKGTYSYHKRYCGTKRCNAGVLLSKFNWNMCRSKYVLLLYEKQEKEIESELIKRKIDLEIKYHFILCEKCGKLCLREKSHLVGQYFGPKGFEKYECVEIHHKQPVYSLTQENILLVFDLNNLICLCESCHNKTKGIKKPKGPVVKFITIERFL